MPRPWPTIMLLSAACLLAGGCSSGGSSSGGSVSSTGTSAERWNAPTTYRFAGLGRKDTAKVEGAFQREGVLYKRTSEQPLTYEVKGLQTAGDVARLNQSLSKVTKLPFETAQVNFGGLDPAATAYSTVEIRVTPGSETQVADGVGSTTWRRIFADKSGCWKGLVNTKGTVARQGGWLYVAATKDGFTRYYRLNIATKTAESLSYTRFRDSELPEPVRGGKATADESGSDGFKWPWEG